MCTGQDPLVIRRERVVRTRPDSPVVDLNSPRVGIRAVVGERVER